MPQNSDRPLAAALDAVSMHLDKVFPLLERAIETCPDELWASKQGGFYYWQQLYHFFALIDGFIKEPHDPPTQDMYDAEAMRLLRHEEKAPDKKALLSMAKTMRAELDAFVAAMTWERLFARNEPRSQRLGREVSNLSALIWLLNHAFYHMGVCDCTLRNHGRKGFM